MGSSVSICVVVKDEARYILEWVAYHSAIGFDAFVVMDNGSTDGTKNVVRQLQQVENIACFEWKTPSEGRMQGRGLRVGLSYVTTEWVLFIDPDEFFVPHKVDNVSDFLDAMPPEASQVCVNWRIFGDSGQQRYMAEPTFERFCLAAHRDHAANRHVKSFSRVAALEPDIPIAVHAPRTSSGYMVNSCGKRLSLEAHTYAPPNYECAQINHYLIRSQEEFAEKRKRGRPRHAHKEDRFPDNEAASYLAQHNKNDEVDRAILRFKETYLLKLHQLRELLVESSRLSN